MKERIIIVFIAVALGLILTTIGFFIYQQAKVLPQNVIKSISKKDAEPTPKDTMYLTVEEPAKESLSDKRTIQIKGKSNPENTIIASTNSEDVAVKPSADGNFSITITIDAGANKLITRAIAPDGRTKDDIRTIIFYDRRILNYEKNIIIFAFNLFYITFFS